jgi:hypothetical protein
VKLRMAQPESDEYAMAAPRPASSNLLLVSLLWMVQAAHAGEAALRAEVLLMA